MSTVDLAAGAEVSYPAGGIEIDNDGQRIRVYWYSSSGVRKRALFQSAGDETDAVVLLHVREVHLRQRGPTTSSLDEDAELADVPDNLLATLRDAGLTPLERDSA